MIGDLSLTVVTQQVRCNLARDTCFTKEPTTYNTSLRGSYILACAKALLLWGARKQESHNNTVREERRTSLLLGRLGVHVVAREEGATHSLGWCTCIILMHN